MSRQSGRSLRRSRSNRMIAGVAGGFGEFFDINAIWFRLLLILAFLPGGVPGLAIYLTLWLIIPSE